MNLQDYAEELINVSISDDDALNYSPIRQTNQQAISIVQQTSPKKPPSTVSKPTTKKSSSIVKKTTLGGKTSKDKAKEQKAQMEEQTKQLQWYQEEYQKLKTQKKLLKEEKTQQLLTINTYKTKLEQSVQNEKKLVQQLNEQMSVTKQALKQANDSQITIEQLKQAQLQEKQIQELQRKRDKEDVEYAYQKKLDISTKQTLQEAESRYELRIHQLNKELDMLRQENVELHRREIQYNVNKKQSYVQSEFDSLKTKYLTTKG